MCVYVCMCLEKLEQTVSRFIIIDYYSLGSLLYKKMRKRNSISGIKAYPKYQRKCIIEKISWILITSATTP